MDFILTVPDIPGASVADTQRFIKDSLTNAGGSLAPEDQFFGQYKTGVKISRMTDAMRHAVAQHVERERSITAAALRARQLESGRHDADEA